MAKRMFGWRVSWPLIALGLVGLALVAWTIGSYVVIARVEEAPYQVIETRDGYELRRYAPMIIAETAMAEDTITARSEGFRLLAAYIFGSNEGARKIDMTTPVVMAPQKIDMTAPVVMGQGRMAFVMPASFKTLAALPRPRDPRVTLRAVPERVMAARRFGWYGTPDRVAAQRTTLLGLLRRDNISARTPPAYAAYNPPFAAPIVQRHEILVEVAPAMN
jgi:SOUL heme-binding protein